AFVVQDLKEAQEVLPLRSEYSGIDIATASKGAAQALLGMVYMQMLDHASAKAEFQKIITSQEYSLVDNYRDNLLEETEFNKESIYEIGFEYTNNSFGWGNNTGDGLLNLGESTMRNQDWSGISWRNYIPSSAVLEEYETIEQGFEKTDP